MLSCPCQSCQSARDEFFSENRISDSASTCKQRKLCSAMITLMPFADHVFDASEVCSKNDFSFLLRPCTSILRYLFFFQTEALPIHQALLLMSTSVQDIQVQPTKLTKISFVSKMVENEVCVYIHTHKILKYAK